MPTPRLSDATKVLFPTDLSPENLAAFPCAAEAARWLGGSVTVLYLVDTTRPLEGGPLPEAPADGAHPALRERAAARLTEHAAALEAAGVAVETEVGVTADLPATIRRVTAEGGYGLVVMATHGREGVSRLIGGSVAEETLRGAEVPVLLVRSDGEDAPVAGPAGRLTAKEILFPTDLSPEGLATYPVAADLAKAAGGTVTVLYLADLGAAELNQGLPLRSSAELEAAVKKRGREELDAKAGLFEAAGAPFALEVRAAVNPEAAVKDYAATGGFDLIVMATHGRKGFARLLLGSVTEVTARSAPCPVVAVRAAG